MKKFRHTMLVHVLPVTLMIAAMVAAMLLVSQKLS